MKETLVKGYDRKTASPTESAVRGSWHREHSGADHLNGWLLGWYVIMR